ncbi:MAG TPA: tetratricopeptide repeat protein [Candidatus Acidoferrales bacterium]|jgi:Flp pilus assembly protein TadD|nr:tetratricopeptide repeat protein [Candidatus Acidoferrales bacterium]
MNTRATRQVKRFCLCAAVCLVSLSAASIARSATPEECQAQRKHGHRPEAQKCFEALTTARDPYLRAEGFWGTENYQEANNQFRLAADQSPTNATIRVRWGRLMHERFNNTEADNLFNEALQRDPKSAQAYYGLALVSADGFDSKAAEYAGKAIELDPKLVEAHELMASLNLEDSDDAKAFAEADNALKISSEALDAMAVHAAIELLADRSPAAWLEKIRQINSVYGEGYALVAYHLVLNRRYEDGIAYYRKAIEADTRLWSARAQLGINLMRIGQEDEPRKQLEMCYENGYRNEETVNSLRLLDSYKNFVTFKDGATILKLNKKEADLLRPYFDAEMKRIIATYNKKYKMTLPAPVQVEVYPDHEDFAVRTMGMPGLGALGVTFGEVIAMDSPSGRPPGEFHWGSTLWHEMSHVYVLTATNFRVPRWFTEGLAVHEETEVSPEWGDRITPDVVAAIHDKKLLPVAEMDRGFIHPEYPNQVIVSYYQAGRICDYIKERWGPDKLLDMVRSFAAHKTTSDVIRTGLGMAPEEFDKQFLAWLDKDVGKTVANFDAWREKLKDLVTQAKNKNYDAVLKEGEEVRALYPDYVYPANSYEFMAQADIAKGDKPAAVAILTTYEKIGGHNPPALKQLASLEEELGKPADAAATLERLNYVYPVDEDLHHRLGDLWFAQNNFQGAIREYNAVIAMNPIDKASAQFNAARAYFAAGEKDKAEDHLLASLEAAPDFRPAQKLLLQLKDSNEGK